MKTPTTITEEAARKCLIQFCEICDVKVPISQLPKCKNALDNAQAIIQAAIEEAHSIGYIDGRNAERACYDHPSDSHAAPSRKPDQ